MSIEEQFNIVAEEYDRNRKRFIPCFDEYYERTTDFIAASIAAPKRIMDLGAGTGLLSGFWYKHFPDTEYVLVDIAHEMLKVAGKRFAGLDNVSYVAGDYSKELPAQDFDCIISALSIHHLENEQKQELFRRVYDKLPQGGIFVNYDQFCADEKMLQEMINSYWKNRLEHSGLTERDLELWRERSLLDRECSVSEEVKFMRESGFENVQCVYSNLKFSVIIAIK